jgi:hypothetical protein
MNYFDTSRKDRCNPDLGLSESIWTIQQIAICLSEMHAQRKYTELSEVFSVIKRNLLVGEYCINDLIRPNGPEA